MAITISNRLITPYSAKDNLKVIWGDTQTFEFTLPSPHQAGDQYHLGIDQDRVVYPPSRPLCAYTKAFQVDGNTLTMTLTYNTGRLRDYVCKLRKPTPIYIQLDRVRNGKCETLLLDTLLALPSVLDSQNTVVEGDPLAELLEAKLDKPYAEGNPGEILSLDADGQPVWRPEQEIPEQEQADWDESDSSAVSYIKNKPAISKVGLTGEYNDLVDKPELKAVATTGSYNDLVDKPAIPAAQVQADYGQSDSGAVDYIKHKPDLSVYSLTTETGNSISMSIDDEYDLVVSLLDKAGNTLSTQDIDLPIESMIVDATYSNGVLTLTLQNGNTVDVDITDIVSGLVPDSRTVNGHALSADVTISYNDLADKPTIPAAQVQSDWDESDSDAASYIRNKPEIGGDADTVQALDGLITVLEKYAGQLSNLDYFYIKCLDANGDNITIKKPSTTTFSTFQVSIDKRKWYDVGSEISIYTSYGDKIYVRGEAANWDFINDRMVTKSNGYFAIGGDMQSLISTTLDHETSKGGSKRLDHCFYQTKIYEVENGFKFPVGVTQVSTFFYNSKLATLPAGFTIPSTVSSLSYCFGSCPNLKSLPDGFTIPSSVTNVSIMFLSTQINTIGNNVSINTGVNNEGNLDKSKVTSIGTGFSYMTAYTTSAASGQAVFPNATIGSGWSIYQYTDEQ